jgi:hypothetical protein
VLERIADLHPELFYFHEGILGGVGLSEDNQPNPHSSMKLLLHSLLIFAVIAGSLHAKAPKHVLVFSSSHEKNYQPPTAENPSYYLPLSGGFHSEGPSKGGADDDALKITKEEIFAALAKPLAAQHFLPADKNHVPNILLVAQWGYFRPDLKEGQTFYSEYDAKRAAQLTGGTRVSLGTFAYEDARSHMSDERYFLILSAYDYAASKKERKKVVLWRTRMSVVMNPTTFAESLAPMVVAGTPFFGRDSDVAREVDLSIKEGHVKVGEAEVIEMDAHQSKPDTKRKH